MSEKAGAKIVDSWTATSAQLLTKNGFSASGTYVTVEDSVVQLGSTVAVDTEHAAAEQLRAAKAVGIPRVFRWAVETNTVPYDRAEKVVDICVDAVLAKKQKAQRDIRAGEDDASAKDSPNRNANQGTQRAAKSAKKKRKRERKSVSTKVAKINCDAASYCLVAPTYVLLFSFVLAFILRNDLNGRALCFFVDGERSLNNTLFAAFSWHSKVRVILDWYHLTKKCAALLSPALNEACAKYASLSAPAHPLVWRRRFSNRVLARYR